MAVPRSIFSNYLESLIFIKSFYLYACVCLTLESFFYFSQVLDFFFDESLESVQILSDLYFHGCVLVESL